MANEKLNILFHYLDYREFLKDRFDYLRVTNPAFSYRYFNQKAGLKSSGHMKMILDGKANLSKKTIYKVCRGLGLSEKEASYFETLVSFNQAKTHEDKDAFYRDLLECKPPKEGHVLGEQLYKIFNHWYYAVILELVRSDDFQEDPAWIAKKLKPEIAARQAKKALEELEELGLLVRGNDGQLERVDSILKTPDEVASLAVVKYQSQMMKNGFESLKRDGVKEREFQTLTVALPPEHFDGVKKRVEEIGDELRDYIESLEGNRSEVVNVNIQLFKLTKEK